MADYDVVVIGSGFAGSAAALSFLEAMEKAGRVGRVALIEAGGKGRWPGASRWAKPFLALDRDNTLSRQRAATAGRERSSVADLEYWRKFEDEVPNTVEFMASHGVRLIHCDEEDVALDFEGGHFAYPDGGGKEAVDFYIDYIMKYESADILWEHEAIRPTLDDEGGVGGVVVRGPDGTERSITADAVVLACGGFQGSPEMFSQYIGEDDLPNLPIIARGLRYNRGAGIRMAMEAGADTAGRFDMVHAELVDTRADRHHAAIWGQNYGIVVNEDCERFHDEGEDYLFATSEAIAYETWLNQNQRSYFITDGTVMDRLGDSWIYRTANQPPEQADTIASLAGKLGLDPARLEATISEFNAACEDGEWDPARMDGKKTSGITPPKSNWATPLTEAPFYGFPMTAHLSFTFGGLKADTGGRVLSTSGTPISGLYAAGDITGIFHHNHPPATSVLRANTFGRLVGVNVARSLPETAASTG